MDLELLVDEEEQGQLEPFGIQLHVKMADMDTSPERRRRSRSRRISFPRDDDLETVAVITPRSQRGHPVDLQEIVEGLLNAHRATGRCVAGGNRAQPGRCLQLLLANDGNAALKFLSVSNNPQSEGNYNSRPEQRRPTGSLNVKTSVSSNPPAHMTPRRRKSSVFEMDEPIPAPATQRPPAPTKGSADTAAATEAEVLQLWGCSRSPSGVQLSFRTTPVLPSSEEACQWVQQAWGWSLPAPNPKRQQESSQEKQSQELEDGTTEAPLCAMMKRQRAKVLNDWGCIPSAEEGIPQIICAGRCDDGRGHHLQSWNAVTEQIVASYLAN